MDKELADAAVRITGESMRKDPPQPPELNLDKTVQSSPTTTTIQLGIHHATMPFVPGAFQREVLEMKDPRIEELKRAAAREEELVQQAMQKSQESSSESEQEEDDDFIYNNN